MLYLDVQGTGTTIGLHILKTANVSTEPFTRTGQAALAPRETDPAEEWNSCTLMSQAQRSKTGSRTVVRYAVVGAVLVQNFEKTAAAPYSVLDNPTVRTPYRTVMMHNTVQPYYLYKCQSFLYINRYVFETLNTYQWATCGSQ